MEWYTHGQTIQRQAVQLRYRSAILFIQFSVGTAKELSAGGGIVYSRTPSWDLPFRYVTVRQHFLFSSLDGQRKASESSAPKVEWYTHTQTIPLRYKTTTFLFSSLERRKASENSAPEVEWYTQTIQRPVQMVKIVNQVLSLSQLFVYFNIFIDWRSAYHMQKKKIV